MQKSTGFVERPISGPRRNYSGKYHWLKSSSVLREEARQAVLLAPKDLEIGVVRKPNPKKNAAMRAKDVAGSIARRKQITSVAPGKHPADKMILDICAAHPDLKTRAPVLYAWLDLYEKDLSLRKSGINKFVVTIRIDVLAGAGLILKKAS